MLRYKGFNMLQNHPILVTKWYSASNFARQQPI